MAYEKGARRFRPVGSRKKKTAPKYGPTGTGCPVVEEAVARLYRDQSEAHFWDLMNALNYALELKTRVLVPLDAATDPQSGAAPWAALPIPEEKAEDLPPWLLHTRRERTYLPLFTSVKTAEAERTTATRPMAERGMREAMTYALNTEGLDGVVIDPWTNSATLDNSILKGAAPRGAGGPRRPPAQMSWTAATRLPATAGGMRPFTITSVPPTRATPRRWLCWRTASIRAAASAAARRRPASSGKRQPPPGRFRP